FAQGSITSLAAGQYVLVASDPAALQFRYGGGLSIAGKYTGNLSNGGEPVEVDDIDSGTVLGFTYVDSWYPSTDGPGNSLVIINQLAPTESWNAKESWRPSNNIGGSPGAPDAVPATVAGRFVFYNQSKFDGNNAAANASDDAAIATDKIALLPGGTSTL